MLAGLPRDIRHAARSLIKHKGFSAVAVLSLGLGFALAATTLAVVNAYLLRAMPFPAAERLHHVNYVPQGVPEPRGLASMDWAPLSDIVDVVDHSSSARAYVTEDGYTQELQVLLAAPDVLEAIGVHAALGRSLQRDDYRGDADRVALIGDALWRERFGADPAVIGRQFTATLAARGTSPESFRIVGVLPPAFRYVRNYDRATPELLLPQRDQRQAYMVRLREGVPVEFAEQRITAAIRGVATEIPADWAGADLETVHERYVRDLKPMLLALTIAAGIVLLIVCVNVAALMLLRTLRRRKEMAVRIALGAEGVMVARLLVVEAALVAASSLALGLAVTGVSLRMLAPVIETRLGRSVPGGTSAIALDPTVLLIIGGAGLLVALALAGLPLLMPWQKRLAAMLRSDGRGGTDGPGMRRARSGLIALEFAASLALLVGGGLMIRSVANLARTDLGLRTEATVRLRIALPDAGYADAASFLAFYDRFSERLAATANAPFALTDMVPFVEPSVRSLEAESPERPDGVTPMRASATAVSDSYFDLLGVDLTQGRGFAPSDRVGTEPVAVVSASLARELWPGQLAVGKRIRSAAPAGSTAPPTPWRTIVGVVDDVRQTHADADLRDVYIPFMQAPNRYAPIFIRTSQPPSFWVDELREIVGNIDRNVLVSGGVVLSEQEKELLAGPRFLMALLTAFAAFAALVALIGIYGVTAYSVQQREREVAIRIALGATPMSVLRLFLREGGRVLAVGIGVGLFAAIAVGRVLESQLFGVPRFDLVTIVIASVVMVVTGTCAILWPSRRAARMEPVAALNGE
jgi:putative ABC transport system permease protein